MRELVYLSHGKLEQFLPELRQLWPKPKFNLKLPFGGFDLDLTADARKSEIKHIRLVINQIQQSVKWFTDPELRPGQWAYFEAPLNCHVLEVSKVGSMLLFIDIPEESTDYETGGAIRLLLHGSPGNRRGQQSEEPTAAQGAPKQTRLNPSSVDSFMRVLTQFDPISPRPQGNRRSSGLGPAAQRFVRDLDTRVHPETAAWMRGLARLTANVMYPSASQGGGPGPYQAGNVRYILGSPLYIEHFE